MPDETTFGERDDKCQHQCCGRPIWSALFFFGIPLGSCVSVFLLPAAFTTQTLQNVPGTNDQHIRCKPGSPWLFFDRVLVISGAESRARRFQTQFCLKRLDIVRPANKQSFESQQAIDKLESDMRLPQGRFGNMTSAEVAITVSHVRAIRTFMNDTSANTALILEDDFQIDGVLADRRLEASLNFLPKDSEGNPGWDILFLGRCMDKCSREQNLGGDLYKASEPKCFHAYALNKAAAKKVVKVIRNCHTRPCPVDTVASVVAAKPFLYGSSGNKLELRSFAVSPMLITQSPTLRLQGSSQNVTVADAQRGIQKTDGNKNRRVFFPECKFEPCKRRLSNLVVDGSVDMTNGARASFLQALVMSAQAGIQAVPMQRTPGEVQHPCRDSLLLSSPPFSEDSIEATQHIVDSMSPLVACALAGQSLDKLPGKPPEGVAVDAVCPSWLPPAAIVERSSQHVVHSSVGNQSMHRLQVLFSRLLNIGFRPESSITLGGSGIGFEDARWPKLATCACQKRETNTQAERLKRIKLLKQRDETNNLEFRIALKVGTTFFRNFFVCTLGATLVHVSRPATGYRVIAIVRNPITRFISGFQEILRRLFEGVCPSNTHEMRPCTEKADHFVNRAMAKEGRTTTWARLLKETNWFARARRLRKRKGENASGKYLDELENVLAAFIDDLQCNIKYYASEHMMTQVSLLQEEIPSETPVHRIVRLESLNDANALSHWLKALAPNAKNISACYSASRGVNSGAEKSAKSQASEVPPNADGVAVVPSTSEVMQVLERRPSLMIMICLIYVHDFLCLGYDMPDVCRGIIP